MDFEHGWICKRCHKEYVSVRLAEIKKQGRALKLQQIQQIKATAPTPEQIAWGKGLLGFLKQNPMVTCKRCGTGIRVLETACHERED